MYSIANRFFLGNKPHLHHGRAMSTINYQNVPVDSSGNNDFSRTQDFDSAEALRRKKNENYTDGKIKER